MKKVFYLVAIVTLICFNSGSFAQPKFKFGHIDTQELLTKMPDKAKAEKAMEQYSTELEEQLKTMQTELQSKYQEYLQKADSMGALVKKTKEEELQDMQQRIQDFQAKAQKDLQSKESELLQPIIDKARKAIDEVAKENAFTYIFDISKDAGIVLYYSEDSKDIMPMVKTKLGIQ